MNNTNEIHIKNYNYSQCTPLILFDCDRIFFACDKHEETKIPYFIDDEPETNAPSLICAYISDCMVGFISTYVINDYYLEICGFVHPDYQRNHIFSLLLEELRTLYPDYKFQVSLPPKNTVGKSAALALHFSYISTECKMLLSREDFSPHDSKLRLFSEEYEDSTIFYLSGPETDFGACMVNITDNTATIHDVEVYEEFRGMGYGYDLLCLVLPKLFETCNKVLLHVTLENVPAYRLYQKLGFQCIEEIELWTLENNHE